MTLTKSEILDRLKSTDFDNQAIVATPVLDLNDQIGISGLDVRLGKQFIVFREHFNETFSPGYVSVNENEIKKYQEELVVPIGSYITLHPGKLIIGSTFEYIAIPPDLECQVEGRSSWARLGLVVATATTVEPCYKGVITLELSNIGNIPIKLYPGIKIAQLIFHKTSKPVVLNEGELTKKKYQAAIGPGFSKIFLDKHLDYFCRKKKV